jgi:basic membrane protein A
MSESDFDKDSTVKDHHYSLLNEKISRRQAIGTSAKLAIGAGIVVALGGGYYLGSSLAPVPTETQRKGFKAALIMLGPAQDKSWNQFHLESMQEIVKGSNGAIELSTAENVDPSDFVRIAEGYATKDFDVVIANSFSYVDQTFQVAPKFPKTHFVVQATFKFLPNLAGYSIWPHEGAYLAGMLGALLTKSNKLGIIQGFVFSQPLAYRNGFLAGARSVNDKVTVTQVVTNTWTDVVKGAEATRAMIDTGVDFVAHYASGPGAGMLQVAKEKNIAAVGSFIDESYVGENVVTSILHKFGKPLELILRDIRDGSFEGKSYDFTLRDDAIGLSPISSRVPKDIKDRISEAEKKIREGTLIVPFVTDREI